MSDDLRAQIAELRSRLAAVRDERDEAREKLSALRERIPKLQERIGELHGYLLTARTRLAATDKQLFDDLADVVRVR